MLITGLWLHLSPLDFAVDKGTLDLPSGTSSRVILIFKGRCSANNLSLLIDILAYLGAYSQAG